MSYTRALEASTFLKSKITQDPQFLIVLGSGLGDIANILEIQQSIKYEEIPNFPCCTAPGHEGRLLFGNVGNKKVAIMKGRFHFYEGLTFDTIAIPFRTMFLLGVKVVILISATGALNPDYQVGSLMLVKDHLNIGGLCGVNPLVGANEEKFGSRFPIMTMCYNPNLISEFELAAKSIKNETCIRKGVMTWVSGPILETISENKFLQSIGADTVGMSLVPENIICVHMGMKVLGINVVTDKCPLTFESSHHGFNATSTNILDVCVKKCKDIGAILKELLNKTKIE